MMAGAQGKYKGVIVSTTDLHKLREGLVQKRDAIIAQVVATLAYVGETCVKLAREDHPGNWNDITGNLRSSIGYVVLVDGQPAKTALNAQFEQQGGKHGDGSQGIPAAKQLLETLQGAYSRGVVLLVVAGMKYAAYVENVRHRVVLSQARLEAERLAKQMLKSLIAD